MRAGPVAAPKALLARPFAHPRRERRKLLAKLSAPAKRTLLIHRLAPNLQKFTHLSALTALVFKYRHNSFLKNRLQNLPPIITAHPRDFKQLPPGYHFLSESRKIANFSPPKSESSAGLLLDI
jgi:hypothetical protein